MNTKERILQQALKLFAQKGFMATSMSDIAKSLDITKAALYKHFKSKQEIFDCVVKQMQERDLSRMQQYSMPDGTFPHMAEGYSTMSIEKIKEFSEVQFRYWTEDELARDFRKMLELEQYRDDEMRKLYLLYTSAGPIEYMTELFGSMLEQTGRSKETAKQLALEFYGPIYLLISMYDEKNKEESIHLLQEHIERFYNGKCERL